jgi:hypothetical protein
VLQQALLYYWLALVDSVSHSLLVSLLPAGQWLLSGLPGSAAASRLALLQWAAFVLPTLYWMRNKGWDVRAVLRLQQLGTPQQWLAGE